MEYEDYAPDSTNSSFKSAKTYRYLGHSLATYQQYVVYVSEGVIKNCYNQNQRDKRLANGRRERRKERLVTALKREGEGFLLHREFIREHRGYVQQADLFTSGRFHRRGYSGTE